MNKQVSAYRELVARFQAAPVSHRKQIAGHIYWAALDLITTSSSPIDKGAYQMAANKYGKIANLI